jgi:hypothetical protein
VETERRNRASKTVDIDLKDPMGAPIRKPIEIGAGLAAQQPIERTIDQRELLSREK